MPLTIHCICGHVFVAPPSNEISLEWECRGIHDKNPQWVEYTKMDQVCPKCGVDTGNLKEVNDADPSI